MRHVIPILVLLSACRPESRATREWTPDDHGHPPAPLDAPDAPAAPEQGGEERAARALWNVSCASCHGPGGRGDGPQPPPGAQLPDFASAAFQGARTDAQLVQSIREGRGLMPAFGKQLNDDGIAALVKVVRSFGPAQPAHADDDPNVAGEREPSPPAGETGPPN